MKLAFLMAVLLASCTKTPNADPKAWSAMSDAERQVTLDTFADQCRLPHSFFVMNSGELHIRPNPDEEYSKVDCALAKIKNLHITKMGFVGNEAYSDDLAGNADVKRPTFTEQSSALSSSEKKK